MWPFTKGPSKFERGYTYAQQCIGKGPEAVEELDQQIDTAREFNSYDDFDRGAEKALKEHRGY